jgi:cytochrome c-type biogenesis protein
MQVALTFLEGMASFLSPCVLPMLPVYALYFASGETSRPRSAVRALSFVAGYTSVFVTLGVAAAALGSLVAEYRTVLRVFCGIMMILFGLSAAGLFHLPSMNLSKGVKINGVFSAFAFGAVYSLCILPCAGAFLGAALMKAAAEGSALEGVMLLSSYSAGLGIPFFLTAVFINELKEFLTAVKRNMKIINLCCAIALIAIGAAFAAGVFESQRESSLENGKTTDHKTEVEKMAIKVTSANFEEEILKSEIPVIVDFWAEWCGPCKMLSPVLDEIAAEKAGVVKVCKVNVDEAPELAQQYGISSIPAVFLIRNGNISARAIGYMSKDALLKNLGL